MADADPCGVPARTASYGRNRWTVLFTIVALVAAWYLKEVLLLLFAAVLLAVVLRGTAMRIARLSRAPPWVALTTVVVGVASLLVAAAAWQGPRVADEFAVLREELPAAVEELRARFARSGMVRDLVDELPGPGELVGGGRDVLESARFVASSTIGVVTGVGVWLFVGVLLAAAPGTYVRGILALVPKDHTERASRLLERLGHTLWWWSLGRLISMSFVGVTTGVGLWLLDVPLAFLLGLIAALLSFVPNIGPLLSAIPAVLLALAADPVKAVWVIGLYAAVQAVEGLVLDPLIDRRTVYLPPALTVAMQLVLGTLAGLLGVALAAPLTAAGMVVVTMLWVQDTLGKHGGVIAREAR